MGRTAFHEGAVNSHLEAHFSRLALQPDNRIFVPLCGKAIDLAWLRAKGQRVVGIELNRSAVEAFFAQLDATPEVTQQGSLLRYHADDIEVYVGDFFTLDAETLGPVDAVYDRAALVALPPDMRLSYGRHLVSITHTAPQLLIVYEYDQSQTDGPPFSVTGDEIATHYDEHFRIDHLSSTPIGGPLAERCSGAENAWSLMPH